MRSFFSDKRSSGQDCHARVGLGIHSKDAASRACTRVLLRGNPIDPEGRRVAIGYDDALRVSILNAVNLAPIAEADTDDLKSNNSSRNISRVSWSTDGATLAAGGEGLELFGGEWHTFVRRFTRDGLRLGADIPVASDSILDMDRCGDGFAFAAADPAFGLLRLDGRPANALETPSGKPRPARRTFYYYFMRSSFDTEEHEGSAGKPESRPTTPPKVRMGPVGVELLRPGEDGAAGAVLSSMGTGERDGRTTVVKGKPFYLDMTFATEEVPATSYMGLDFGTSTSSTSYVNESRYSDISIMRVRRL